MPKKGDPKASDSNFHEPPPPLRPKLFKPNRLKLWDILDDAVRPKDKFKGETDYHCIPVVF